MSFRSIRSMALLAAAILLVGLPTAARADDVDDDTRLETNKSGVFSFIPVLPIRGNATLTRSAEEVEYRLNVGEGIPPGAPVTIWMVAWNNPERCARLSPDGPTPFCNEDDFPAEFDPDPLKHVNVAIIGPVGGAIANANGAAHFKGELDVNDVSRLINSHPQVGLPFTGGLLDAFKAEIHLIVHTHPTGLTGAALQNALTSFDGGCEADVAAGCPDVSFATFLKGAMPAP